MDWSCMDIRVLMFCHYSPNTWDRAYGWSKGYQDSLEKLHHYDLVARSQGEFFELTDRGNAMLEHILSTPLPQKVITTYEI